MNSSAAKLELRPLPHFTDSLMYPPNMDYDYFSANADFHFNYLNNEFDINNCWWLSEFALLAYEHPRFIKLTLESVLKVKSEIIIKGNFQGFVAYCDEWIVVSFRGTRIKSIGMLKDLSFGAMIKPVHVSEYGMVHKGFLDSYIHIWLDEKKGVKRIVQQLLNENPARATWFTGHSMGGALAVLAAQDMKCPHPVYTFGCPKIGNEAFVQNLEIQHLRLVHSNDIVVRFPLPVIKCRSKNLYQLDGKVLQITSDMISQGSIDDKSILQYLYDMWKTNRRQGMKLIFWTIPLTWIKHVMRGQVITFVNILSDSIYEIILKDMMDHAPVLYSICAYNNMILQNRASIKE
jgi:hypothetical protein